MASYMLLFIFGMILFLIDARPYAATRSGLKNYNNRIGDAMDDEIHQSFNEQAHRERQLRTLNRLPEVFFSTYQQRDFRHHHINTNGYNKRNVKYNDYYPSEYPIKYDRDYSEFM